MIVTKIERINLTEDKNGREYAKVVFEGDDDVYFVWDDFILNKLQTGEIVEGDMVEYDNDLGKFKRITLLIKPEYETVKETDTKIISDKYIYDYINDLILTAAKNIVVVSPWIHTCRHLLDNLVDALNKKIKVTIITRDPTLTKKDEKTENLDFVKEKGAKIIYDNHLHAKIILVDDETVVISSANLTSYSLVNTHELGVYSKNKDLIQNTKRCIERWAKDID